MQLESANPATACHSARGSCAAVGRALISPPLWFTLLACATLLIYRRWDIVRSPQFWAEDATIFFEQSHTVGLKALLQPYAGYLHLLPRIAAAATRWLDPALAPALFSAAAFSLTLYVAALTQSKRCPLPHNIAFALAVVLVPDASEVLLFLVNVQWVLACALILLLIAADPQRPGEHVHDTFAAILLGLTGPFSVLFAPMFVWRAWQRRTAASVTLASLILVCGVVQLSLIFISGVPTSEQPIAFRALFALPGSRLGGSLLIGTFGIANVPWATAVGLGLLTVFGAWAMGWRKGPWRAERLVLVLACGALFVSTAFRGRYVLPELGVPGYGPRYFFSQQLLLLWLVLVTAYDPNRWIARSATVAACWMLAVNLPRLREPGLPDLNWPAYAARIRSGEEVTVPVNPDWTITLPGRASDPLAGGIVNFSARARVEPGQQTTIGFIVQAGPRRTFLIRAIGPSLRALGIPDALARPAMRLLQDGREHQGFAPLANGSDSAAIQAATKWAGAFLFAPGSADLACIAQLETGSYMLTVWGKGQDAGEVMIEVFEVPKSRP